jgi:hypothetical protein
MVRISLPPAGSLVRTVIEAISVVPIERASGGSPPTRRRVPDRHWGERKMQRFKSAGSRATVSRRPCRRPQHLLPPAPSHLPINLAKVQSRSGGALAGCGRRGLNRIHPVSLPDRCPAPEHPCLAAVRGSGQVDRRRPGRAGSFAWQPSAPRDQAGRPHSRRGRALAKTSGVSLWDARMDPDGLPDQAFRGMQLPALVF